MIRAIALALCLMCAPMLAACDPIERAAAHQEQTDNDTAALLASGLVGYAVGQAMAPTPQTVVHQHGSPVPFYAHNPAGRASRAYVTIPSASPAPRYSFSPTRSSAGSLSFRSYSSTRSRRR